MIVNSKIVLAFAAGALAAAGIVYVALKPSTSSPRAAPAAIASTPALAVHPVAEAVSTPERAATPAAGPAPSRNSKPSALVAKAAPPSDDVPASVRTDPEPAPTPPQAAPQAPVAELAPIAEPAAPEPVNDPPPSAPAPVPAPNRVTIPTGTPINIRLSESLSTDRNEKGDMFFATLDQPLIAGGFAIAERGARVEGEVVDSVRGGKGGGAAHLILAITKVHTSDGQKVTVVTTAFDQKGNSSGGENAAKVGGGAVLGAIIGAALGGGKGAGIGAAAGGAAGAGGVMMSRGRAASLPTETRLSFKLQQAVTITERAH